MCLYSNKFCKPNVAPRKVIQESPEFRIPRCGFRIPCLWIPDSTSMDSGFHFEFWIPLAGSRFHRPKLPGFRIQDYLTWGDKRIEATELLLQNANLHFQIKIVVCSYRFKRSLRISDAFPIPSTTSRNNR